VTSAPLPISTPALERARLFFEDRGTLGFEGTAMLAGTSAAGVTRCVIPDQHARRGPFGGVSVEVTDQGKLELATALALDERYLARIHSHPGDAFHSETDDRNPGLTAEGALSIVVPFFGLGLRRGLEACAVFVYRQGEWLEIPETRLPEYVVVI
jgi:hypothetical protein